MSFYRIFILILLTFVESFNYLQQSLAEDDLDIKVCAAVYPCDNEGNVIPEFNEGPCAEIYQIQCAVMQSSNNRNKNSSQFKQCKRDNRRLEETIRGLRKKLIRAEWRAQNFKRQLEK